MRAALLILDGAGYATPTPGNAVTPTTLPFLFQAMKENGFCVLDASGEAVGLENGQVGNSEVGHLTIGAGQVVPSMLRRIDQAFRTGTWATHPMWSMLKKQRRVLIVGLLSDAGVHAHYRSLIQAVSIAVDQGVGEVVVHPVLDGVDSKAGSAAPLFVELQQQLKKLPNVRIGMVIGRRWFCDRSGDLAITRVFTERLAGRERLEPFRMAALTDHLATGSEVNFPGHLFEEGCLPALGETILLTSNRADRAVQVARVLSHDYRLCSLIELEDAVAPDCAFFAPRPVDFGVGFELREHNVKSLRIAEQCEFPHVTFFINGFHEDLEGQTICVPSIPESAI